MARRLIIVTGPTAVGKTDFSIDLALRHGSPVISCDSRQIFREMEIGTAVPDASQLSAVKHYFIQERSVLEPYTAGMYEIDALALMDRLFDEGHEVLVMSGGSMFYVDAVCRGLDDIPAADPGLRRSLEDRLASEGVESLRLDLRRLDPQAYRSIDLANPARVLRAVEVCLLTGRTFSSYKLASPKERNFKIEKIELLRPRDELYRRIDMRVEKMVADGLVGEVRSLLPLRDCTALRTVGYTEIFDYLDGKCRLDEAVERIKTATRHYAKKQMTWWKRDPDIKKVWL